MSNFTERSPEDKNGRCITRENGETVRHYGADTSQIKSTRPYKATRVDQGIVNPTVSR